MREKNLLFFVSLAVILIAIKVSAESKRNIPHEHKKLQSIKPELIEECFLRNYRCKEITDWEFDVAGRNIFLAFKACIEYTKIDAFTRCNTLKKLNMPKIDFPSTWPKAECPGLARG